MSLTALHPEPAATPSETAEPDRAVVTHIPERDAAAALQARRNVARVTPDDVLVSLGAVVSAWCTTMLLFGRLTAMNGVFGFVVVWFALFLIIYAFLVSRTNDRPAVVDKVMGALLGAAAVIAGGTLLSVIAYVLWRGHEALFKVNFFTEDQHNARPNDGLDVGGITHGIVGTLIMTAIALVLVVPLGVSCAVFLYESRGRFALLVRTVVTAMTALPSVLAGLFIYATWTLTFGFERSGLAASLAMSVMMLPIIIRSADVVLRLVPGSLKEAAAALGATRWRTVWNVVLPTARSGLTTSVILGVARGIGETAPVLLTAGFTKFINYDPTQHAMVSLPLLTYDFVRQPQQDMIARGFATAAVLMGLVLLLFTLARVLGGRPAGSLSARQAQRATVRSAHDLERFEQLDLARSAMPGAPITRSRS